MNRDHDEKERIPEEQGWSTYRTTAFLPRMPLAKRGAEATHQHISVQRPAVCVYQCLSRFVLSQKHLLHSAHHCQVCLSVWKSFKVFLLSRLELSLLRAYHSFPVVATTFYCFVRVSNTATHCFPKAVLSSHYARPFLSMHLGERNRKYVSVLEIISEPMEMIEVNFEE